MSFCSIEKLNLTIYLQWPCVKTQTETSIPVNRRELGLGDRANI